MFTRREKIQSLNGIWKFNPDPYQRCRQQKWWKNEGGKNAFFPCFNMEGLWDCTVPSTWKKEFEELKWYDGHANYVLDFEIDEVPEGHEAFLCFDAVTYRSEIYLNGMSVGTHEWGYSPFQFRVTEALNKKNRLFVLVDNFMQEDRVPGIRSDWNNDGGITGAVKLIFVPKVYIQNFRTMTRLKGDDVMIDVSVWLESRKRDVAEELTFKIEELGINEKFTVSVGNQCDHTIKIPKSKIELWCPKNPKLYKTELVTKHETVVDEIGYREIKTEGKKIILNGEELRLYGVAVHSEFPDTGRAATEEGIEKMLAKARELGVNFLRCAHYPYADIFARAMDKAGMLWWEEVPVYWLPNVHLEPQCSMALGMMREAVLRDWNRASLIFWSVSNECAGDGSGFCNTLEEGNYPYWVKACAQLRDLDPSRLISSADSGYRRTLNSKWTPDAGDAFDEDMSASKFLPAHPDGFYEMLDVLGANLYVTKPGMNPKTTDLFVDMLKDYDKPLMITEFGSMSTSGSVEGREVNEVGHPEYHSKILQEGYASFHDHEEIVGYVPWSLMDVRVPMHWRWYNRGSGTFAYGLSDNQYQNKAVFKVVQDEIKKLRKKWGASQD